MQHDGIWSAFARNSWRHWKRMLQSEIYTDSLCERPVDITDSVSAASLDYSLDDIVQTIV